MTETPTGSGALLQMTGIVKEFPGVRALGGVDLDVRAGEVHCLLGQNGAGKSTLIKVLSAVLPARRGHHLLGRRAGQRSPLPQAALKPGIATIYQELDLVPDLSVAENIFLGHELSHGRLLPAHPSATGPRASCSPGSVTPRSRRPARSARSRRPASRS